MSDPIFRAPFRAVGAEVHDANGKAAATLCRWVTPAVVVPRGAGLAYDDPRVVAWRAWFYRVVGGERELGRVVDTLNRA